MDRNTFLDHLRQSGLLTEEQLTAGVARFGDDAPADTLVDGLIADGLLTTFQAKRLCAGKGQGLVLGQYRILDELGRGGFGQVYKALHTVMDRIVAIKVIAPELIEDERARTWFKREVLALTQLYHPNIVMAYDANEADGMLFLVMEYVDGQNLEALVRKQGPLPFTLACELMRQAAQALQYAHEKGMVHRDIKPGNLLIPNGAVAQLSLTPLLRGPSSAPAVAVKVVDFGLARLHSNSSAATLMLQNEKSFLGTPDYVSPEQAYNVHAVDIRSDLYSLGCTFYHALTGQRPFRGTTALETVVKHLKEDAPPLEELRPETPAGLGAVIRRLMAKEPEKRFQTPAELIGELAFLCGQEGAPMRLAGAARPAAFKPGPAPASRGAESRPLPQSAFVATAVLPALSREDQRDSAGLAAETPLDRTAVTAAALNAAIADQPAVTAVTPVPAAFRPLVVHAERPNQATPFPAAPSTDETAEPEGPAAEQAPLSPAELAQVDAAVRRAWQQWTEVVEAITKGQDCTRVREEAYQLLHGQLLALCGAQAKAADPARRVRFQRLEAIAEPWLTARALASADRGTLAGVLQRCRAAGDELGCSRGVRVPWMGLTVLAVLAVVGFLGWQLYRFQHSAAPARSWFQALKRIVQADPVLWTALALPVVILLSIVVVARWCRPG